MRLDARPNFAPVGGVIVPYPSRSGTPASRAVGIGAAQKAAATHRGALEGRTGCGVPGSDEGLRGPGRSRMVST